MIEYLVVKLISINGDYNRKTHGNENKFKDHCFDLRRVIFHAYLRK
jgi:hypothetical protein